MNNYSKIASCLVLVLALLLFSDKGQAKNQSSEGPVFEIAICSPQIATGVKARNESFYSIFRFEVADDGKLGSVQSVHNTHVQIEDIVDCLRRWKLEGLEPNTPVSISLYWKHGIGWREMSIAGKGIRQKILLDEFQLSYGKH